MLPLNDKFLFPAPRQDINIFMVTVEHATAHSVVSCIQRRLNDCVKTDGLFANGNANI